MMGKRKLRFSHTVRAEKEKGTEGSDSTESLFAKELEKRGMSGDNWSSQDEEPEVRWRESPNDNEYDDQFSKARALGSEGLEGLIPRAKELLKLGAAFSLAFGPAIAAIAGFAAALYLVFGDSLVHGGRPGLEPPQYIDPYELLEAESQIPMVPFNKAPPLPQSSATNAGESPPVVEN
ncbi:hypothetical protein BSKO_05176 [Bryopsis sp. KO-2023]|nr:hypothetical protein BSKO_05176 [Bryopsis sp. KO-2023]